MADVCRNTSVIIDFRSICEKHKLRIHTKSSIYAKFDWTSLKKTGNCDVMGLIFDIYKNKRGIKSPNRTLYAYLLNFDKIWSFLTTLELWRETRVWRSNGHFECCRLPVLKWVHMKGKLKLNTSNMSLYGVDFKLI